jgi:hypothetical protein
MYYRYWQYERFWSISDYISTWVGFSDETGQKKTERKEIK